MALQIRRATKKRAKLRMNIEGQPGGGKTYTALLLAKLLIGEPFKLPSGRDSKIVLIDSERSSAELYADEFDFGHIDLPPDHHSPEGYIEAIREGEKAGAEVIIADSITHEWKWCLTEVDRIKGPKFGGNKWSAWSDIRPRHDNFVDAMMGCMAHFIATTRAKPATDQVDDGGKKKIVKLGLEGIQDDMIEFAFGVVMRVDADHTGLITKTRCRAIDGKVYPLPGEQLAADLRRWLDSGDPLVEVAHTLEAALQQGLAISLAAAEGTEEAKKAAWQKAKELVLGWCRGHGRSSDEAKAAVDEMARRVKAGKTGGAKPANGAAKPEGDAWGLSGEPSPESGERGPAGAPVDDAAMAAAIDAGRA